MSVSISRTRWAAVGAAVAITLGAGGIGLVDAAKSSGERAVYTAIEPCRLLDTRPNQNIQRNTPLGQGETYDVTAIGDNGQCSGIPADTVALELNVTGLLNTAATDFVVWSGAGAPPNASHINLALGAPPTPNSVTTELDGNNFSIRNKFGQAHVIVDIVGIYQDHNHDDRYYTETEVDAMLNPSSIMLTPGDFRAGENWTGSGNGVTRPGAGATTCAYAAVSIPAGRTIESFDIRYVAQAVEVEVRLRQDEFAEGFIDASDLITTGPTTLEGVGLNEFYYALDNLPVSGSATVLPGMQHQLEICSGAQVSVSGVRINFAN
ncbi:MAG: hypothetical protein CL424_10345 [Acidimicrobiaceae bacterium]|nr:hypothetical protein [Acidimicrobiaceae bacterium]